MSDKIVVDVSQWKMRHYSAYFNAMHAQNFDRLFELVAMVLKSAPFIEGEVTNETIADLSVDEWSLVGAAVAEALNAKFSKGN